MPLMPPIRVVVADDSAIYRQSLLFFLQRFPGLTVVATAQDGEETIQLVGETTPDLLILDINMPKKDGWEVISHLHDMKASVYILVLTAHSNPDLKQRALNDGAAAWVSKGDIPQLTDTLHQLLTAG